MMLTIITHVAAVRILFAIGITLTVLPIFFYNVLLKHKEEHRKVFAKHMPRIIIPGVILCLPMIYYFYLDIRFSISEFTDDDILFLAAERRNTRVVTELIEKGADPENNCRYGISPIYRAVMENETEMLELYLKMGADPNHTGEQTITLLGTACVEGNTDMVRLLIMAGADPDYRPNLFIPAIHYAAMYDEGYNDELIALLIDAGADPASKIKKDGKVMLPFRYYFDKYTEAVFDGTITEEEKDSFARISEMLYYPYIDYLEDKVSAIEGRERDEDEAVS